MNNVDDFKTIAKGVTVVYMNHLIKKAHKKLKKLLKKLNFDYF